MTESEINGMAVQIVAAVVRELVAAKRLPELSGDGKQTISTTEETFIGILTVVARSALHLSIS